MKTWIKNLFFLHALVTCFCFIEGESAQAQSGIYNGYYWQQTGNSVAITGYNGPGGVVTVPGTIPIGSTNLPVTSIGAQAFAVSVSQLTSITIPDSVTSIGSEAFYFCTALTNVVLGIGVNNIGSQAFYNCAKLPDINIPNGVTNIGEEAFLVCGSLTNVAIGSGVISIGAEAFSDSKLLAFTVNPENLSYSSLGGVLFDKNQTTLIAFPVGIGGSYAIPNTVTNIGEYAFDACFKLTNVSIPASVTSIGFEAFLATGLTNVTIPDSVTSIGASAFAESGNLTSVTIGSSVTNIGANAFRGCNNLQSIYFRGSAPLADSSVFITDPDVIAYCLPGTTGWNTFAANTGIPVALWLPQIQTGASSFGVQTNQFGFDINWTSGQTITIEACTNFFSPDWQPLQTNTFTGNYINFSDPEATNFSARFYRIISP